jgi:predicted NBD/HSP70 family sugar kinase
VIAVFDDGIGSGLIINGRVYRGGGGMAGEIGHLLVPIDISSTAQDNGQGGTRDNLGDNQPQVVYPDLKGNRPGRFSDNCYCGHKGHLDCYATPERIRGELGGRDFDELAAAPATLGDSPTREGRVFQLAGQALGIAIVSLINLNDPSRVLLFLPPALAQAAPGSAAEQYLGQIKEMLTEHAFSNAKKTPVDYEQLSAEARRYFGAKAAAVRVIDSLLQHAKRQCTCYIPKPRGEHEPESDDHVIDEAVATLHDRRVRL